MVRRTERSFNVSQAAATYAPPCSIGAHDDTFKAAAISTSCGNPRSRSSTPDTEWLSRSAKSGRADRKTSRATAASGESEPASPEMIAPAPIRSSMAGLRLPSFQRSPAGMTASVPSPTVFMARSATADALRRQPARMVFSFAANEIRDPFGDGSTRRVPSGIPWSVGADRLNRAVLSERFPASSAFLRTASARAASRSSIGNGNTCAPLEQATSTQVEKDRTSTTTKASARSNSALRPDRPHSEITCICPGPSALRLLDETHVAVKAVGQDDQGPPVAVRQSERVWKARPLRWAALRSATSGMIAAVQLCQCGPSCTLSQWHGRRRPCRGAAHVRNLRAPDRRIAAGRA